MLVIEPIAIREESLDAAPNGEGKRPKSKPRMIVNLLHCDIIEDGFWMARPHLLE